MSQSLGGDQTELKLKDAEALSPNYRAWLNKIINKPLTRTDTPNVDKTEVLSVEYLNSHRALVDEFKTLAKSMKMMYGWHYLMDFAWAGSHLPAKPGAVILDAGAGYGVMQWWTLEQGADVISVDRGDRRNTPVKFRKAYSISGVRPEDFNEDYWKPEHEAKKVEVAPQTRKSLFRQFTELFSGSSQAAVSTPVPTVASTKGNLFQYNHDVQDLAAVPSESVDAIVSISALEHNTPENLKGCVDELLRVLKPGGSIVATLGAAQEKDWFHEPSKGWNYTEETLRQSFQLGADYQSNFTRFDELFEMLKNNDEMREDLHEAYFKSGDNGMPWGVWDPQYQIVGVVKVKS